MMPKGWGSAERVTDLGNGGYVICSAKYTKINPLLTIGKMYKLYNLFCPKRGHIFQNFVEVITFFNNKTEVNFLHLERTSFNMFFLK